MRRLLLAGTAAAGLAVLPVATAMAQTAPSVTINGFARFYGAYVDQDNNSTGGPAPTETGDFDFNQSAEVVVNVRGVTASGIAYGAQVEIQFDNTANSTRADLDEMFLFLNSPTLGAIQLGNNEGAAAQFYTGSITGFATGGVDGDFGQFITDGDSNGNYYTQDLGDGTKVIYRSPEFFGLDFGLSFGFNQGEGTIDRSFAGDREESSELGNLEKLRNIYEGALRYRREFAGIGFSIAGGAQFAEAVQSTGVGEPRAEDFTNYFGGIELTFAGFTLGGTYSFGDHNGGIAIASGDDAFTQYFLGAQYAFGSFTLGANYYNQTREGAANATIADDRKQSGYSLGLTYNFAPGLDFVAEYTFVKNEEEGAFTRNGAQASTLETQVVILGAMLTF